MAAQPREAWQLEALQAKLTTPQEAFAYVRDHVAFEPYSGVMKGAAGALLTHGANDEDRALLLAALLSAQGIESKIAYASVAEAAANAPLDAALKQPDAVGRMLATLPAAAAPAAGEPFDSKVRRETLGHGAVDRSAEVRLAFAAQNSLLKPAAAKLGPPAFIAPHRRCWVQAAIDGATVDLDTSQPESRFGAAPARAEGTWEVSELPEMAPHVITVRVVEETLAKGALTRRELLTREFRSADLLATGFRLVLGPVGAPETATDFQASVVAAGEATAGETFRVSGTVPKPADSAGAGGLLGGFGGAPEPAPAAPEGAEGSQLARLWVEIAFHSPGLPDETDRRMIVDRVERQGDSWKVAAGLAAEATVRPLLVQVWDAGLDVGAPHLCAWMDSLVAALKTAGPLRAALTSGAEVNRDDLPAPTLSPQLQGFFFASGMYRHWLASSGRQPVLAFYSRPRLAFLRHGFVVADWSRPAEPPRYAEGIDLVNSPLRDVGAARGAALFALQAGVLDTVLEQYVSVDERPLNTVPLIAAAQDRHTPLLLLGAGDPADRIDAPPAIRAAVAEDLAQGRIVLAPEHPVALAGTNAFGWWSIDPRTGATLGKMELGGGQAMMEVSKVTETVGSLAQDFGKLMGNMIRCYGGAIGASLGGKKSGKSVEMDLVNCLREAVCTAIKDFQQLAKSSFPADKQKWVKAVTDEELVLDTLDVVAEQTEVANAISDTSDLLNGMAGPGGGDDDPFSKGCKAALGGGP